MCLGVGCASTFGFPFPIPHETWSQVSRWRWHKAPSGNSCKEVKSYSEATPSHLLWRRRCSMHHKCHFLCAIFVMKFTPLFFLLYLTTCSPLFFESIILSVPCHLCFLCPRSWQQFIWNHYLLQSCSNDRTIVSVEVAVANHLITAETGVKNDDPKP